MVGSVVPAVIINNLPSHLRSSGEVASIALLGSKTGKEAGALFWRIHPTLTKFMVVFMTVEDRNAWVENSQTLKKAKAEHGVRASSIWFNRDSGLVMKKDGETSPNTTNQGQGSTDSKSRRILLNEFEDLSKLFGKAKLEIEENQQGSKAETEQSVCEEITSKSKEDRCDDPASSVNKLISVNSTFSFLMPMSVFLNPQTELNSSSKCSSPPPPDHTSSPPLRHPKITKATPITQSPRPEDIQSKTEPRKELSVGFHSTSDNGSKGVKKKILEELRRLQVCLDRKNFSSSQKLVAEIVGEVGDLSRKSVTVEGELIKVEKQLKALDIWETLTNQQNEVLRTRNASLVDESAGVVNSQKMLAEKIKIVCDAVSHFSDERKFVGYVEDVRSRGLQELSVLLDGLSKLRENRSGSEVVTATVVRLGLEDGRTVRFSTNRYRKIGIF